MRESLSIFVVPDGTEGMTTGERTDLLGWDASHNASIQLDEVRVPAENLIGEEEGAAGAFLPRALPYITTGFAACYVGLARSAYELAKEYANERVSWGEPIINHQAVTLKLADMYVDLQTVFRFLHVFTGRIQSVDGLGVYCIDSTAHDDQTMNTLKQLFDGVIEVERDDDDEQVVMTAGIPTA